MYLLGRHALDLWTPHKVYHDKRPAKIWYLRRESHISWFSLHVDFYQYNSYHAQKHKVWYCMKTTVPALTVYYLFMALNLHCSVWVLFTSLKSFFMKETSILLTDSAEAVHAGFNRGCTFYLLIERMRGDLKQMKPWITNKETLPVLCYVCLLHRVAWKIQSGVRQLNST